MGNHQLTVGDVDGDGKDEVCNGASAIDDDGKGLYVNGLGHGDALHMTDMDPSRSGQEVWQCHESPSQYGQYGLEFRDAKTGQPLWGVPGGGADVGRAMAADIDPNYPGYEVWGSVGGLYTNKGVQISTNKPTVNFGLWWDGDLQRELLDAGYNASTNSSTVRLEKWNSSINSSSRLLTPSLVENGDGQTNNGTKANPSISADIFGDWREEFILRSRDNTKLLIYTTIAPTEYRIPMLMHDAQYRTQVALQNSAYNQPPHPSFYLGEGMTAPPAANITLVNAQTSPWVNKATILSPVDGASALSAETAVLDWEGTADRYNLYMGASPDDLQLVATGLTESSYALAEKPELKTYFWRVDALRDGDAVRDGELVTGEVWSFTLVDKTAPTVVTKNIAISLDKNGQATITAADVNNGSNDTYGIGGLEVNPATFDCSKVGSNVVTLTVTDKSGNTAAAPATVTVTDDIAPTALAKNITVKLKEGAATITATELDKGSSDACGIASLEASKTAFDCSNVGENTVTFTVMDKSGNQATATAIVTVVDDTAPTALAKDITVTLKNGAVSITSADLDNGSNDACGVKTLSLSKSSFDCSNVGANQVTLTVTDKSGNTAQATATVTVVGATPAPAIVVSRTDNTYTGGTPNTIFLGYGAQQLTLTASDPVTAGTTYSWSPAASLSSTTSASPTFAPIAAGDYAFTVTATNVYGCSTSTLVTLHVVDARCGTKNSLEKVLVCHEGQLLCIAESAVAAHLNDPSHHDQLGSCPTAVRTSASNLLGVDGSSGLAAEFEAYPNPFTESTTIRFQTPQRSRAKLQVYNTLGQLVTTLFDKVAEGGQEYSLTLEGKNLAEGVYSCRLLLDGLVQTQQIVVVK